MNPASPRNLNPNAGYDGWATSNARIPPTPDINRISDPDATPPAHPQ